MNYINLSMEEIKKQSNNWAQEVQKEFKPDIIIYVAKAGFLIAYEFSKVMRVSLIGVKTVREKGNGIKDFVAPIVRKMPNFVRNILITLELKSGIHSKNNKRTSVFIDDVTRIVPNQVKKILIIDDSIDTGASIVSVKKLVKDKFPDSEIRIAGLNVWDKSKNMILTDYCLYENVVIKSPMSKDSIEYDEFIHEYNTFLEGVKR